MEIHIIKPGLLVRNNLGMILQASSTVTLILDKEHKIIVDTALPGEGKKILSGLFNFRITKEDIDIVINTHLHGDHVGNNALFSKSKFIAHENEFPAKLKNVEIISGDYEINENIRLIETPGHTPGSISVVMHNSENNKTYVISGDALPIKDNYLHWVPPGINYNPKIALASMQRIVDIADIIIPGHDDMFFIRSS